MQPINILQYAGASISATQGALELFAIANRLAKSNLFDCRLIHVDENLNDASVIIVPPCMSEPLPTFTEPGMLNALKNWAAHEHIIASNCAGVFWLAEAGLLNGRVATTHWALYQQLQQYDGITAVDRRHMVIDEGAVITAAGLFAYQDLVLHLIQRYGRIELAEQVADFALLDFKNRNQLYYQHFAPSTDHQDDLVLKAQRLCMQVDIALVSVSFLAERVHVSERTLTRRFLQVLGMNPGQYLQKLKIEKARSNLRLNLSIATVAERCGYQDVSNFSRAFKKHTGLTPAEYRTRQQH
jgi:transcriptional regulator GlxA family with amidase domain